MSIGSVAKKLGAQGSFCIYAPIVANRKPRVTLWNPGLVVVKRNDKWSIGKRHLLER